MRGNSHIDWPRPVRTRLLSTAKQSGQPLQGRDERLVDLSELAPAFHLQLGAPGGRDSRQGPTPHPRRSQARVPPRAPNSRRAGFPYSFRGFAEVGCNTRRAGSAERAAFPVPVSDLDFRGERLRRRLPSGCSVYATVAADSRLGPSHSLLPQSRGGVTSRYFRRRRRPAAAFLVLPRAPARSARQRCSLSPSPPAWTSWATLPTRWTAPGSRTQELGPKHDPVDHQDPEVHAVKRLREPGRHLLLGQRHETPRHGALRDAPLLRHGERLEAPILARRHTARDRLQRVSIQGCDIDPSRP